MLRKCEERTTEWDKIVKYFLFTYRNTPHSNTWFSPFEVVFGRPIRGPLEVLKDGWMTGDVAQFSVVEWINTRGERLADMKEVVSDRKKVAKEKMKALYDRQAKDRQLEEGTLILVRTPDLKGKLEDVWDGPFEVTRRISPVTYEITVPRRRSKHMVTHMTPSKFGIHQLPQC